MDIYLASGSQRRIDMLEKAGLKFKIVPADIDESEMVGETAEKYVLRMALKKAEKVFSSVAANSPLALVLGADTIVEIDSKIMGKPAGQKEAKEMLKTLSGQVHVVFTGFAVKTHKAVKSGLVRTQVRFRVLSDNEIDAYVDTGEAEERAGAYAIQGDYGAILVERVDGSYSNVIGLPLKEALDLINKMSWDQE
ncbi:MAG: Maf family protein [Deltaproteobacteria bacterium]|jgi:septum formation protein|nr:Maf family protein [Deltaproteobacteria bacterium]